MNIWEIIVAIILGAVEGLTEYAPVSSTGHLIIVDDLWLKSKELLTPEVAYVFKIVIQLGSILAVAIVFRERIFNLIGYKNNITTKQEKGPQLTLTKIIVGLMPAVILGFLFEDYVDQFFTVTRVAIGLILGAFLMIIADWINKRKVVTNSLDQITYKQALGIGLFQCIALWPGFSRSGSTISGGVILGLNHRAASDFTFIMAIPIMMGASFLSLIKNWEYLSLELVSFFTVGFISSFVVSMIVVRFFLKLINKIKLIPFAIYRIILGIILLSI
jgi:undecaprenyl-diphosphatase